MTAPRAGLPPTGRRSRAGRWTETLGKLIELDNEQWTRVNPEMLALGRRLRKAGAKTAILSNMEFEMLAAMEAKFQWLSEFAVKIFSCKVRMAKPAAEIFLHTAAELAGRARLRSVCG